MEEQKITFPTAGRAHGRERPILFGLSDPLVAGTGFGRVMRELFVRLAAADRFDLAYLSTHWIGTSRFPGVQTYADNAAIPNNFCQNSLPLAAVDYAGAELPFVLLTLLDTWMTSWLARPETSMLSTDRSRRFLEKQRSRFAWVQYFPLDGLGPGPGKTLPRWCAEDLRASEVPVAMSTWARDVVAAAVRPDVRYIPHAADVDVFRPIPKPEARALVEKTYAGLVARAIAQQAPEGLEPEAYLAEIERRRLRLDERFVVVCVMQNRARKYWNEVVEAFAGLVEHVPDAVLIGVCGDRSGRRDDGIALEDRARELGLRLDTDQDDPNCWLIDVIADTPTTTADESFALLYSAADVAVLLSAGEGFGLPQLEAHACGRPCLVGDYSASTEQAVDSRELVHPRAYYLTPGNQVRRPVYRSGDLADRLWYAARNPRWCAEVGARARACVLAAYDWRLVFPQWLDLLADAGATPGTTEPEVAPDVPRAPAGDPAGAPAAQ